MFSKFFKAHRPAPNLGKKKFFEKDEEQFFINLKNILPACYVFPRIAISNLLSPISNNEEEQKAAQVMLAGRKVDYAIFDQAMELLWVIELNVGAPTNIAQHSSKGVFKRAGIKTMHWDRDDLPSLEQMERILLPVISTTSATTWNTAATTLAQKNYRNPVTLSSETVVQPKESGPRSISSVTLDALTPQKQLRTKYPHIWQRICLFCDEPEHLQKYLASLTLQDRGEERVGFPTEVLREIADLQVENDRFSHVSASKSTWETGFQHR